MIALRAPQRAAILFALSAVATMRAHDFAGAPQGSTASPSAAPQTMSVDQQLASGDSLLSAFKYADAARLFESILESSDVTLAPAQQARALCGLSGALLEDAKYQRAYESGIRCVALYEQLRDQAGIGRASMLLNSSCDYLGGRSSEARTWAERAVAAFGAAGDEAKRLRAEFRLLRGGDNSEPPFAAHRSLVERVRPTGDRELEGEVLHSWGDGLFGIGKYDEALDTLTAAADSFTAAGDPEELGTVYNSIGRLYRVHGRFDEALRFQRQALAIHARSSRRFLLVQSLNAVASVHLARYEIRLAREHYERAVALASTTTSPRIQDFLRANLALANLLNGEFEKAKNAFEDVLAHGIDIYTSQRQSSLSNAYLRLGRAADALTAAQRAAETCGSVKSDCIVAANNRAAAHAALGDRTAALADVAEALQTVEAERGNLIPSDFFKQNFHQRVEGTYGQAIALQMNAREEARALETAELARSRAFLDLLATRDGRFTETREPIADPQRMVMGANARPLPVDRSVASAPPATVDDLVAVATRLHSTVLSYWISEEALYVWAINARGLVASRRVDILRSRLIELVRRNTPAADTSTPPGGAARRTVATRGAGHLEMGALSNQPSRELYDVLIRPIRDVLPARAGALLTIVPHGPLSAVSFASLEDARGRYLIEDFTIHYAPAGAVFQFTATRRRGDGRDGAVLLVADPRLPMRSRLDAPLPRLPGARSEARAIARLLAASRVTMLEDADATESRVRAASAGKSVIHFATHAIVRDNDTVGSFLALGRDGESSVADGTLTGQDIYGLDLAADLVVLSACRSAGADMTGEGISMFARGFIYAGVPSLVMSLWDVADEPTNRLLPAFYRAWFAGASKASALRRAQLALLRELRAGRVRVETELGPVLVPPHPVFWAGFVLEGEPD